MTHLVTNDLPDVEAIRATLASNGFWTGTASLLPDDPNGLLLSLMTLLGTPYVPDGCSPESPVIATAPSLRKSAAPFDRPEAIGWHGDFASHEDRPRISLVHIVRGDPAGPEAGAWRLASTQRALDKMAKLPGGPEAIELLRHEALPFSYSDGKAPKWFKVIEQIEEDQVGLRFFAPSVARGFASLGRKMSGPIADALSRLKGAADEVQVMVPTRPGSLLVIDNWRALHDRTPQSAGRKQGRLALLGFVAELA